MHQFARYSFDGTATDTWVGRICGPRAYRPNGLRSLSIAGFYAYRRVTSVGEYAGFRMFHNLGVFK
jgi:hypothetical protein